MWLDGHASKLFNVNSQELLGQELFEILAYQRAFGLILGLSRGLGRVLIEHQENFPSSTCPSAAHAPMYPPAMPVSFCPLTHFLSGHWTSPQPFIPVVIHPPINLPSHPPIFYPLTYVPTHLPIHWTGIHMLVALSFTDPLSHPSVLYLPFVHSPIYRLFTICLFLYPSLHQLSIYIPVHLLIDLLPSRPSIFHLLTAHQPLIYASIHPSTCPSIYPWSLALK